MLDMYKGVANSPETTITNEINNKDTLIYVLDETRIPAELPNLMVLGTGTSAETVKVLSIDSNIITVERGFQGVAKAWNAGTIIARNFTEYDYNALVENIQDNADKIGILTGKVSPETPLNTTSQNLSGAVNEIKTEVDAHKADMENRGFTGSVKSISGVDLNDILVTGFYGGNNLANAPAQGHYYVEVVSYNGSSMVKQRVTQVTGVDAGIIWERVKNTNWEPWYRIYTDKPIPLIEATLQNGWVNVASNGILKYFKDSFGIVHISGEIKDGVIASSTIIANLPVGYRPRHTTPIPTQKSNDGSFAMFNVDVLGNLVVIGNYTTGAYRINGSFKAV